MTTTLVLADDHPLMLDGLSSLFGSGGFAVVARARDGLEARAAIRTHAPALAVLDVNMPRPTGLDLLREARAENWATRIVLLTAGIEPDPIAEALRLRVDGLLLKDAPGDVLLRCARQAIEGRPWIDRSVMEQLTRRLVYGQDADDELTSREREVARYVAQGMRNKEIGLALGIGEGTVKMHLHNLYQKLGIASRTELALLVRDRGWAVG